MHPNKWLKQADLLQEGVSCALATLHAIEGADLFRALPAEKHDQKKHGHASWLLAMLTDQLTRLQEQVDALDVPTVPAQVEG
jgi:hypothetical protein